MSSQLAYPFDVAAITRRRRKLVAELAGRGGLTEARVALLGGSTTSNLKEMLELFLLDAGIRPSFYESEYSKYEEDVMLDDTALRAFAPQVAIIHTTWVNARGPAPLESGDLVAERARSELARFEAMWSRLAEMGCTIVQNNFDIPLERSLGHLDGSRPFGLSHFLRRLNLGMAETAARHPRVVIHDIDHLSALIGLDRWHDRNYWFNYKLAVSPAATVALGHSLAALIRAIYGKTRKCLVLDLDNTLWGGVIGDEGVEGLRLGRETPEGEAYTAFQEYCLGLKKRGVLLAVCSKNEPATAQEGFAHPDSVLKLEDFSAFKAGWGPKHEAIQEIAHELNIGLDSFVFADDNPAERALVAAQLPMVAVPDIGSDPARYVELLDRQLYFEPLGISADDVKRSEMYASNVQRNLASAAFSNYGEFLDSLQMKAEVGPFVPTYIERIAQLTNKSNQFNLTTRRYTVAEMDALRTDPAWVTLYGRLADKFGDNGLITVVTAKEDGEDLRIDLWLMSCRVLKRDMELVMLDELVMQARARGVRWLRGEYLRTARNGMVADHYEKLGFEQVRKDDASSEWRLDVRAVAGPRNTHIREILRG
jgi:FkbH-like protein